MRNDYNFNELRAHVLEEIKSGKPVFGKEGAFVPLLENILNAALKSEMNAHPDDDSRQSGNRRHQYCLSLSSIGDILQRNIRFSLRDANSKKRTFFVHEPV